MTSAATELAIITGALKLLSPGPERWTQGAYARDAKGNAVPHYSLDAVCFDLEGALKKSADPRGYEVAIGLDVARRLGFSLNVILSTWQDAPERKYSDVIALLQTRADQLRGEIEREGGAG